MSCIFTVIIPTRNRAAMLLNAVRSVQQQTFRDWEVIIVDDGSTDNTQEALVPFLSDRIKVIRNEVSGGPAAARNRAIRAAHPESRFISLLDDDDVYHPRFLEKTYEVMKSKGEEVGFCWTAIENYYPDKNTTSVFFWDPPFRTREEAFHGFLEKRLIGTGYGITFRKSIFSTVGYFDESIRAVEDTDFFLRTLRHFFYTNISEPLIRVTRQTTNHVNTNSIERAEALERIAAKHKMELLKNAKASYNFIAKIASIYFRVGRKDRGRNTLREALKRNFDLRIVSLWLRLEILG